MQVTTRSPWIWVRWVWLLLGPSAVANQEVATSLWSHVHGTADVGGLRSMSARWDAAAPDGLLALSAERSDGVYAWATIVPPQAGWDVSRRASVDCDIAYRGAKPLKVLLWVVGEDGWDAVADVATLAPGETRRFSCALRETFPDGTPKLDPGRIKQIQIMTSGRRADSAVLEVHGLRATGEAPAWSRPTDRLVVPAVEDIPPSPGHRVRYSLAAEAGTGIYSVVHLPTDWKPGVRYPVIVEFPGNQFYIKDCYSPGRPEQCTIGYGMSRGQGAICLSLPFVDRKAGAIVESGWGDADDTAAYAVSMVEEVCAKFGGDRSNLVLTGFSRGAIACGYIGLRNERIAALWKGIHGCQHYDGDGWGGATMQGAIERARRFRGTSVFQTDNGREAFQPVMEAMRADVVWAKSGLGAHATAMFLDDRPSTQQLRRWFRQLVGLKQIKQTVVE